MEKVIHQNNSKKSFTKILLMGNKGVGKTSIKSIIFQQQLPQDTLKLAPTNEIEEILYLYFLIFLNEFPLFQDTLKLAPTNEIEEIHLKILGNINTILIDCCGKEDYISKYFTTKRKKIFSEVNILLFITDASEPDQKKSLDYFKK